MKNAFLAQKWTGRAENGTRTVPLWVRPRQKSRRRIGLDEFYKPCKCLVEILKTLFKRLTFLPINGVFPLKWSDRAENGPELSKYGPDKNKNHIGILGSMSFSSSVTIFLKLLNFFRVDS